MLYSGLYIRIPWLWILSMKRVADFNAGRDLRHPQSWPIRTQTTLKVPQAPLTHARQGCGRAVASNWQSQTLQISRSGAVRGSMHVQYN